MVVAPARVRRPDRSKLAPRPREGALRVSEVQRARILAAMSHVVAERGVASVTVAHIVARAGVSRRTFYQLFDGCDACFLGVFEDALAHASRVVSDATASASPAWREQVRAGLGALLSFFDREPGLASVLVVDALSAGPDVLARRAGVLESLAAIVDEGRSQARGGPRGGASPRSSSLPPSLVAEGVVGAVLAVIHARMLERRPPASRSANGSSPSRPVSPVPLIELLNPLMGMLVLPYLGQAAASRELDRPPPSAPPRTSDNDNDASRSSRRSSENPLEGLNMRLTYRTLQVLSAIASTPGASNREVADQAGVHDQGQISKLLARLEKLGLIHNTGAGQPSGEPNAWTLTPQGQELEQALTAGR